MEVLTPEMQAEYRNAVTIENWRRMLEHIDAKQAA